MADILTLVFRTFRVQTDVKRDPEVPSLPPQVPATCRSLVVSGEHRISRSLLLLAAVTAASETGIRVVFFSQTQIQSLPVSLQKCIPSLSPECLKKIKFCYPRTLEELLQQVAGLHESTNTSPTPPSLIIVDGLDGFLSAPEGGSHTGIYPGEQSCAAHLAALLCDSATFLTQLLSQRSSHCGPCRLIASFQARGGTDKSPDTDPILDVLDRYLQVRCTLDQDRSYVAAAAGLEEVWNIYLSGTSIKEASLTKDSEDRLGVAQEWQLLISHDGSMEFKNV